MSDIFSRGGGGSRRGRLPGALIASVAAVAVAATACSGGGTDNENNGGNGGGGSANNAAADCGRNSTDPYPGVKAADAPGVTAKDVKLPQDKPGKGKPSVKIGTKDFAESVLVGQLYKTALEAKGFTVKFQPKIGASETIDAAFKSNQVDLYPEYLGEIASSLADNPPQKNAKETYQKAKKFEQDKRDATIFKQTPYQDVDIMLVTPEFCKKNNLSSAADLKNVGNQGSKVTFAAQTASRARYSGFKGLKEAYGLKQAHFKGVQAGGQALQVVKDGDANLADGFSTTTSVVQAVKKGEFVALKDPKHIMGFQHVGPVVKQSVAQKQGPAFKQTLNWVNSKLTLKVINQLNKAVQLQHTPEAEVAKKFLDANGLK